MSFYAQTLSINIYYMFMLKSWAILLALVIYRIICALGTRNYEYPDEHWQGPQIAHKLYYGYGYLTWEWIISQPLRNPLYPYLLSLSYPLLQLLHLKSLVVQGPKFLVQTVLAVLADYYLIKTLKYIYHALTPLMLIFVFSNWYYASCLSRTYSNSFETCLTILAFYFWISNSRQGDNNKKDFINRIIVTLSYVSRPTSIMLWAILWPYQLYEIIKIHGVISGKWIKFVLKNIINLAFMMMLSFVLGSLYYSQPTLTQWNFIKYNFVFKWSQLYGQEHFLFYFLLSLPFMMHVGLFLFLLSFLNTMTVNKPELSQNKQNNKVIRLTHMICIVYLLISSLSTHKQHRFIFPILPLILISSSSILRQQSTTLLKIKLASKFKYLLVTICVLASLGFFYCFAFYGKSDKPVWKYIDSRINIKNVTDEQISVIVFGESHFMTGYSLLHRNITYRTPNSSAMLMSKNSSQTKLLWQDPDELYKILTKDNNLRPNFIIAQGKYLKHTRKTLVKHGYIQTMSWRFCTIPESIFIEYDTVNIFQIH